MIKIKKKIVEKEIKIFEVSCDNCDKKLKQVFASEKESLQYEFALVIKFSGGYGMYIDPMMNEKHLGIFCKDCATKLIDAFPGMEKIINNENWSE